MYNGGREINYQRQISSSVSDYRIEIVEQPATKALRFRYECEGRSAGSIPGASSTPKKKTYPTIKLVGGPPRKAVVVVSCVTKDQPHRPHPHKLVGRDGCEKGVCTVKIPPDTMTVSFPNLGIQCVKRKDVEESLRIREEIRVDPFKTGFGHKSQPIDLNTVRLCFQVFIENENHKGKYNIQLDPKVSTPICDKKAMIDLNIVRMSDSISPCDGGKEILLFCEKVSKEDIQVRFYDDADGWETSIDIQPSQVHKQTGIWFNTPAYKRVDIEEAVRVQMQLRRPSDGAVSESRPFEFWPSSPGNHPKRKRTMEAKDVSNLKARQPNILNIPQNSIKLEPTDPTSPLYPNLPPQGYNIVHHPNPTPLPGTVYRNPQLNNDLNWRSAPTSSHTPIMPNHMFMQVRPEMGMAPPYPMVTSAQYVPPAQAQYELPSGCGQVRPWSATQPQNPPANNQNAEEMPDLSTLSLSDIVPDITTDSLTNFVNSRAEDLFFRPHN